MASLGRTRAVDENNGELLITSPGAKMSRKRKMEERDENTAGDFEWETSKENVMPLKRGRVVDDLNRALRTHDSFHAKTILEHEAKAMEASVHAYKGSDPLGMWVQYVKWIETKMPEDTRKKFGVLEKSTRELKDYAQYKNDVRYIRLWVQYADLVSNPKDIFKYLYQNKIGENVSLFYVAWAWVLESMANYAQAHKVYLKATQKNAQPSDMLDRKYKEFQRRMSRHWLKVSIADGSVASDDAAQRFALEDITTDGVDIQRFGNSENFRRYAQAQAEKMQKANAHKPVFTVYEDLDGGDVDLLAPSADWKQLDTVRHQNKENDTAPTRWNEGPISRRAEANLSMRPAPTRAESSIQVFVDDAFSSNNRNSTHLAERERSLTLRQRIEGASTEEEQLAREPLKNFTSNKRVHEDEEKPPRVQRNEPSKAEKFAWKSELLKSATGHEQSFEEVRAQNLRNKVSRQPSRMSNGYNRFLVEQPVKNSAPLVPSASRYSFTEEVHVDKANNGQLLDAHASKPNARDISSLNTAAQDDMTINTRLAMEDVNYMFCSPSREEKPPVIKQTVWEVTEPVERKLHFSIYEDSIEVSINPNDLSLRNDRVDQVQQSSFQVFEDEVQETTNVPRTASKMPSRKPLSSRDDLASRSRLTNKDMLLKVGEDEKTDGESESAKKPAKSGDLRKRNQAVHVPQVKSPGKIVKMPARICIDPYKQTPRKLMIESSKVDIFAATSADVYWHTTKTPSLWTANDQRRKLKRAIHFRLDEKVAVEVVGFLGSGAFAQVFSAKVDGLYPTTRSMAMKVEKTKPNLLWEMYITERLHQRIQDRPQSDHTLPLQKFARLDIFTNGACLLMEKAPLGTLHDLLNVYRKMGRPFPEALAIHYTIRMLLAIEAVHDADILHGDIKPDNWLLAPTRRRLSSMISYNNQLTSSSGDLRLIDFGRAIDITHYPPGTTFCGNCHVKGFQTIEMISNRPWTHQIDTFGVCATVHCMLFGSYMEVRQQTSASGSSRWTISQSFKRYWQVDLWKNFFNAFLNVPNCDHQPSLSTHRRNFERFFEDNHFRLEELREILSCQERLLSKPAF